MFLGPAQQDSTGGCASWVGTYRNTCPWVPWDTYGSMGEAHTMGTIPANDGTHKGPKHASVPSQSCPFPTQSRGYYYYYY
jgi:hypothetical protein